MIRLSLVRRWCSLLIGLAMCSTAWAADADPWIVLEGGEGPGKGKQIVLVSGDEEYRSEEALPQLAKILAKHHGFRCTVLFSIDKADGTINPNIRDNIPGLEALKTADLMVIFYRFRNLPDEQMRFIADYVDSGRPIVGMRTSTHAFDIPADKKYGRYSWNSKEWEAGFGRQVLGETWINHHGQHGKQSTGGVIAPEASSHPILKGIHDRDIWGATDVYEVRLPMMPSCQPLVLGQVLEGMQPADKPIAGKKNDPLMPVAWVNTFQSASGKPARVFNTTMGASQDLTSEGTRRMLVNACYWAMGLEDQIPAKSEVAIVGNFEPLPFKFGGFKKGVHPADLLKD